MASLLGKPEILERYISGMRSNGEQEKFAQLTFGDIVFAEENEFIRKIMDMPSDN